VNKGLLGLRALTVLLLLVLAAAPSASARAASRNASSSGWELARVPPRLVPVARSLLRAPHSDRIARWSGHPRNAQDTSRGAALPRIVGGTGAVQGQFGFMAFILFFDSNGNPVFLCSGTLVSSNVVLTAGHCAVDEATGVPRAASGYRVVTGAVDWTDATHRTVSGASRVIVNPGFTTSGGVLRHDAALLVLSSPVSQPAVPLWSRGQVSSGEGAVIAGWGETFAGQANPQAVLQWARTVVQSPSYCGQFNSAFDSASQLCVVNPPTNDTATCNGDSGGPLLAADANNRLFEIGLTSVGPADCNTDTADYFTAVRPIEPWVSSVVSSVATGPRIPTLTLAAARGYVRQRLSAVLGSVFRLRRQYNVSCSRDSAIKVACQVSFRSGRSYYHGPVTIRYVLVSGKVDWTDRYVIHSVNNHCYFQSGHRSSCVTHTRSGS
jgi:trypsin